MLAATLVARDSRRGDWPDDLVDRAMDGEPLSNLTTGHRTGPVIRGPNRPRHEQRDIGDIERRFLAIFRRDIRIVTVGLERFSFEELKEKSKSRGLPVCGTRRMLSVYLAASRDRPADVEDTSFEAFLQIPSLFTSDELESMVHAHIFSLFPAGMKQSVAKKECGGVTPAHAAEGPKESWPQ